MLKAVALLSLACLPAPAHKSPGYAETLKCEEPIKKELPRMPDWRDAAGNHLSLLCIKAHLELLRIQAELKPMIETVLQYKTPAADNPQPARK